MSNPDVIGITGYARNGKDTVADILVNLGYIKIAFADTLRSMALVLNPVVLDYADGEGSIPRLKEVVDKFGWDGAKENPEVRRFLQVLGTEAVREHLGEDIWVTTTLNKMEPGKRYVISDVRFPNEEQSIHDISNSEVWRVTRPGYGIGRTHASEAYIDQLSIDFELKNDSTIEELVKSVHTYLGAKGT